MNEKLLRIVNERQLVSMMNKTKWRELCQELGAGHISTIHVRYKLITSIEILGFSAVCWDELFEESSGIEWLDFDPIVKEYRGRLVPDKDIDRSDELLAAFNKHGIKYSVQESYFRVWGYLSRGIYPEFI